MTAHESILAALQSQVTCYRQLAKLAELQHEHVQQGQTQGLLDVLGKRQQVLDEISGLERILKPAKSTWPDFSAGLAPGRRGEAEGLLAETRKLLEQITVADRNDTLVLQQRQLNLGHQINQATAARQVNRNYAAAAYGRKTSGMDLKR